MKAKLGDVGSKAGLEWRDGKSSEVGSTDRIKSLNKLLHSHRPSVDLHRTRIFTKHYKETEGESYLRRRYFAMAKVYETLPAIIFDNERLVGWQGLKPRSENICIEVCADWLEKEIDYLETRDFDPFKISDDDKTELLNEHIPYWKDKTIAYKWSKRVKNPFKNTKSGICSINNYISNIGTHFTPDYETLLKIGFKGYKNVAVKKLSEINLSDSANVGKEDFYEGIIAVCNATKELGKKYSEKALDIYSNTTDENRKKELLEISKVCSKVPYYAPESFYEALQTCWFALLMLNVEGSGAGVTLGRFDQYMFPFLEKDLNSGKISIEDAIEFIEELYIKITNIMWFQPKQRAEQTGGYYRFISLDVGGLTKNKSDASNLLSYLCLRALRNVRTTAPSVHVQVHQKTPDSLLYEAAKLTAEGMGHPSYFDVETLHASLRMRNGGFVKKSPYTEEEIREGAVAIGCVEPGVQGLQFGHTSASLINLGNTVSLVLNNGIFPKDVDGWGAGTLMGVQTGDPRSFSTFDELMDAVKIQLSHQIRQSHADLLVAEKLHAEEFQLPTFTILSRGAIEKGLDVVAGGAMVNIGPAHVCIGIADIGDSLAAIKMFVLEKQEISMDKLLQALDANFVGFEDVRQKLIQAPKYGNDDDYVDDIVAEILRIFAEEVSKLRCWKGHINDPGIQTAQANVAAGMRCWALPNGRLAGRPLADTMSASQNMDLNGPTATLKSYGKIDHSLLSNGTILNMWFSKSDLVNH